MSNSEEQSPLERVRKTYYIQRNYDTALGDLAEYLYGDRKKKSQVIETLLDQTEFRPQHTHVKETLQKDATLYGAEASDDSFDTIPNSTTEEDEEESEELGWEDIKNNRDIDKAHVVAELLGDEESDVFTRQEVQALLEDKAGYSVNAARNIAKQTMRRLIDNPIQIEDLEEEFEELKKEDIDERKFLIRDTDYNKNTFHKMTMEEYCGVDISADAAFTTERARNKHFEGIQKKIIGAEHVDEDRRKLFLKMLVEHAKSNGFDRNDLSDAI